MHCFVNKNTFFYYFGFLKQYLTVDMGTNSSFLPLIINSGDLSLLIFSKLLNLSLIKNFVGKILYRCFAISATDVKEASKTIGANSYFLPNSTAIPDHKDSP